jgi:hypothetical protein
LVLVLNRTQQVTVNSAREASVKFRGWIDLNFYGSRDLPVGSGVLKDARGIRMGHVSYNGRVWDAEKGEVLF